VEPAPTAQTALPATLGEFRIDAVLGQGGSGIVYDARWGPRRVALKVLHANLVGTGKERSQFLAEAQRLQQIGHPSVVKVLTTGQLPDERPYLAMEHLEGETLATLITKGALPLGRALALFSELCGAVTALHEQGLVHRDLKPENVFVVGGEHAVLLDFGIAKDLGAPASTTTQEGNVRGTPAYMAPERFFGQPAGIATDIYELALVLYAMLAGRLPWNEVADPEARLSPRPLVELAPVPETLDVEIRRALSTRAQNRPPSASALHAAVSAAATGASTAEPEAAETARMRSGEVDARARVPEQPTPLAWAPTLAAPSSTTKRTVKRWPWVAGSVAVIAASGTFAYVRLGAKPAPAMAVAPQTHAIVSDSNEGVSGADPWATRPEPPPKSLPLAEQKLAPAKYRAETVAAIQHLPDDTRVVFTAQIDELRAQSATDDMLDKLAKDPRVTALFGDLPPCVKAMISETEWIAFGAPTLDSSEKGTLVMRGRWRRKDVEACLTDAVKPHVAADGAKLYRLGDTGWIDFLDDHTAYATIRPDLEAEAVHAMVARAGSGANAAGPVPHVRELLAKLPVERSIAFVIDGKAKVDWQALLKIPNTSDVYGWVRLDATTAALDVAADTHDEAAAKAAQALIEPQIKGLFDAGLDTGKVVVARDKTTVHVKGTLSAAMLMMVSMALSR
jgi:serine/threonine protein kinase